MPAHVAAESRAPARPAIEDRLTTSMSGYLALALGFALLGGAGYVAYQSFGLSGGGVSLSPSGLGIAALVAVAGLFMLGGLYVMEPNYSAVLQFFGSYVGTDRSTGLRWVNPLYNVRKVSCRVQTIETSKLKVNDSNGNPVEIATAVLWRVDDAAKAVFRVEDYEEYVSIQAETCVRKLASSHPYDDHSDDTPAEAVASAEEPGATHVRAPAARERVPSLLGGGEEVIQALHDELSTRLAGAGLVVEEARITHLAYAPEIAPAMLRRQQAQAIIAARAKIVTGAVQPDEGELPRFGRALDALRRSDMLVEAAS